MHAWTWYTLNVSESGPCPGISIHTTEYNPSGVGRANDKFAMPHPEPYHAAVSGQQLSKSSKITLEISDQCLTISKHSKQAKRFLKSYRGSLPKNPPTKNK